MQTICSTGIRVSEVQKSMVEALHREVAEIRCKGKIRQVFLPKKLCRILLKYAKKQKITSGPVFVTRTGKPLDRGNLKILSTFFDFVSEADLATFDFEAASGTVQSEPLYRS